MLYQPENILEKIVKMRERNEVGKHLIVDIYEVKNADLITEHAVTYFLNRLVKMIDMEMFVPPIVKVDTNPDNSGISGICMITTSHISLHHWDRKKYISFDCYSCKNFDHDFIINMLEIYFPGNMKWKAIQREFPE